MKKFNTILLTVLITAGCYSQIEAWSSRKNMNDSLKKITQKAITEIQFMPDAAWMESDKLDYKGIYKTKEKTAEIIPSSMSVKLKASSVIKFHDVVAYSEKNLERMRIINLTVIGTYKDPITKEPMRLFGSRSMTK